MYGTNAEGVGGDWKLGGRLPPSKTRENFRAGISGEAEWEFQGKGKFFPGEG